MTCGNQPNIEQICKVGKILISSLPKHVGTNGKNVCYNAVLGCCSGKECSHANCQFNHVPFMELPVEFVTTFVKEIRVGMSNLLLLGQSTKSRKKSRGGGGGYGCGDRGGCGGGGYGRYGYGDHGGRGGGYGGGGYGK